jgi:hypothetical protein
LKKILSKIGFRTTLREAIRQEIKLDELDFRVINVSFTKSKNKSTLYFLAKSFNPHRTGFSDDNEAVFYKIYNISSVIGAMGAAAEAIIEAEELLPGCKFYFHSGLKPLVFFRDSPLCWKSTPSKNYRCNNCGNIDEHHQGWYHDAVPFYPLCNSCNSSMSKCE